MHFEQLTLHQGAAKKRNISHLLQFLRWVASKWDTDLLTPTKVVKLARDVKYSFFSDSPRWRDNFLRMNGVYLTWTNIFVTRTCWISVSQPVFQLFHEFCYFWRAIFHSYLERMPLLTWYVLWQMCTSQQKQAIRLLPSPPSCSLKGQRLGSYDCGFLMPQLENHIPNFQPSLLKSNYRINIRCWPPQVLTKCTHRSEGPPRELTNVSNVKKHEK